jgi:hypothetical protein
MFITGARVTRGRELLAVEPTVPALSVRRLPPLVGGFRAGGKGTLGLRLDVMLVTATSHLVRAGSQVKHISRHSARV